TSRRVLRPDSERLFLCLSIQIASNLSIPFIFWKARNQGSNYSYKDAVSLFVTIMQSKNQDSTKNQLGMVEHLH
ncbi:hypothetical protein KKF04_04640, partial [Patescibacteria group bacterium]|nr:hypothetical protein [Patescibacteria group bacterium]